MSKNNQKQTIGLTLLATAFVAVVIFSMTGPTPTPDLQSEAGEINYQAQLEQKAKELETEKAEKEKELKKLKLEEEKLKLEKQILDLEQPEKKVQRVEQLASQSQHTTSPSITTSKLNSHELRIYKACNKLDMTLEQTAFVLANTKHETARYKFFKEIDGRNQAIKLGYQGGANWYGRGYIQLTHLNNYKNWSKWTGKDLVANPDLLVTDLDLSAFVACSGIKYGSFTAKGKVSDYINDNKRDYYNARSLVNGDKHKVGKRITSDTTNYIKKLTY